MPRKLIDVTGQRFGRLVAVRYLRNENGRTGWLCKCDCGNETVVHSGNLRTGKTTSCRCLQREMISKRSRKDISGQRFGRLLVLKSVGVDKFNKVLWYCKCDCGTYTTTVCGRLVSEGVKSCGCIQDENRRKRAAKLKGKRFGRWLVIGRAKTENGNGVLWHCRCDCGNESTLSSSVLNRGTTQSCGCLSAELTSKNLTVDMSGKRFGRWTVLKQARKGKAAWLCRCDCGVEKIVDGFSLRSGGTKSCGCYSIDMLHKRTGENSPVWNPDRTYAQRVAQRGLLKNKKFVAGVLRRDKYTCQVCGKIGGKLRAHHLDGYHWCKSKRFNVSNGVTMCKDCHKAFHKMYGTHHNKRSQYVLFKAMHKQKTREAVNA